VLPISVCRNQHPAVTRKRSWTLPSQFGRCNSFQSTRPVNGGMSGFCRVLPKETAALATASGRGSKIIGLLASGVTD